MRALDISAEFNRLAGLDTAAIRDEWQRLYRVAPASRLSRDMLIRGIVYRLQERAFGPLPKSLLRRLATDQAAAARPRRSARTMMPGTRLVRDWHGETHTVTVRDRGYEWRGQTYRSLSLVAREITGTNWSGPRFFGLTSRSRASDG